MKKFVVVVLAVMLFCGSAFAAESWTKGAVVQPVKTAVSAVADTAKTAVDSTVAVPETAVTDTAMTGETAVEGVADTAKSAVTGTKSIVGSVTGAGRVEKK